MENHKWALMVTLEISGDLSSVGKKSSRVRQVTDEAKSKRRCKAEMNQGQKKSENKPMNSTRIKHTPQVVPASLPTHLKSPQVPNRVRDTQSLEADSHLYNLPGAYKAKQAS